MIRIKDTYISEYTIISIEKWFDKTCIMVCFSNNTEKIFGFDSQEERDMFFEDLLND